MRAQLRRLVLRLVPRRDLRQPLPRPGRRRGRRQCARPDRLDDGTRDEAATVPFSTRLRSDAGARRRSRSSSGCATRRADGCAFAGDAADRYAALAERAADGTDPDRRPGDRRDVRVPLRRPDRRLARRAVRLIRMVVLRRLPRLLEAAADPAVLGVARTSSGLGPPRVRQQWQRYPNFVEGFPGDVCSDSDNPDDHAAWTQAGDAADASSATSGAVDVGVEHVCRVERVRRRPVPGAVRSRDGEPRARRRQPLRPRDPLRGGGDRWTSYCPTRRCSPSTAGATPRCSCRRVRMQQSPSTSSTAARPSPGPSAIRTSTRSR